MDESPRLLRAQADLVELKAERDALLVIVEQLAAAIAAAVQEVEAAAEIDEPTGPDVETAPSESTLPDWLSSVRRHETARDALV